MNQSANKYNTVKIPKSGNASIRFLYNTVPGRFFLRLLIKTFFSKLTGLILSSPVSRIFIKKFIIKNNINMDEYRDKNYKSFNDFFIREIKEGLRPFPQNENDLAVPGDGKLTAYKITNNSTFKVKNSEFSVSDMLEDKKLVYDYLNGTCLILRLTPDDYHRYAYIDDGEVLHRKHIKGVLHTVRPIAYQRYKVFCRNTREYTIINTKNFGKIIQIEVGALLVGRITNYGSNRMIKRGEEKGVFQFGGSTIIMLFQKDTVKIDDEIYENTKQNRETIVKMGNKIGEKCP